MYARHCLTRPLRPRASSRGLPRAASGRPRRSSFASSPHCCRGTRLLPWPWRRSLRVRTPVARWWWSVHTVGQWEGRIRGVNGGCRKGQGWLMEEEGGLEHRHLNARKPGRLFCFEARSAVLSSHTARRSSVACLSCAVLSREAVSRDWSRSRALTVWEVRGKGLMFNVCGGRHLVYRGVHAQRCFLYCLRPIVPSRPFAPRSFEEQ